MCTPKTMGYYALRIFLHCFNNPYKVLNVLLRLMTYMYLNILTRALTNSGFTYKTSNTFVPPRRARTFLIPRDLAFIKCFVTVAFTVFAQVMCSIVSRPQ